MNKQNEKPIWDATRPWTKEQIIASTFRDFTETLRAIESLPGGIIASELESVYLSLTIFVDATYDLLASINFFKGESERPDFWHRTKRSDFETLGQAMGSGFDNLILCQVIKLSSPEHPTVA